MWKYVLLFLLIPSIAFAICPGFGGQNASSGGSCSTEQFAEDGASGDSADLGRYKNGFASQFVYTGTTTTICRIYAWLSTSGSPTHTVTFGIWGDDSGDPDSGNKICTSTSRSATTFQGSETKEEFVASCSLTNGTTYWVVGDAGAQDGSNYILWHMNNSGTTELIDKAEDVDGAWESHSSTYTLKFSLNSN